MFSREKRDQLPALLPSNGFEPPIHFYVPHSPSSIIWYSLKALVVGKVTAALAESTGSLLLGLTNITRKLTGQEMGTNFKPYD